MNGRTGCLPDNVVHDISKNLPLPDDYMKDNGLDMPHSTNNGLDMPHSTKSDKIVNNYGGFLQDLCKICSLIILNGRASSDHRVGKWTCTKYNGQSLVACTADLYDSIVYFCVSDPLTHSDHSVINFSLAEQKRNLIWNSRTVIIKSNWTAKLKMYTERSLIWIPLYVQCMMLSII